LDAEGEVIDAENNDYVALKALELWWRTNYRLDIIVYLWDGIYH